MKKARAHGFRCALAMLASIAAVVGTARATTVKIAGKLNLPANANVVAICTDPVVQRILNEDLRAARRNAGPDEHMVTLTVTVNQQFSSPASP